MLLALWPQHRLIDVYQSKRINRLMRPFNWNGKNGLNQRTGTKLFETIKAEIDSPPFIQKIHPPCQCESCPRKMRSSNRCVPARVWGLVVACI